MVSIFTVELTSWRYWSKSLKSSPGTYSATEMTSLSVSKASIIRTMLGWSSSLWILHSDLRDFSSLSLCPT